MTTSKSLTLHPLKILWTRKETEMQLKCELKMFNFQDRNRMKQRAHVSVDFGQILVMKLDYDFRSVNQA